MKSNRPRLDRNCRTILCIASAKRRTKMARKDVRRRFGQVNKMRSGRWQARFTVPLDHPCGRGGQVVTAPHTFEPNTYGREAAGDWLRAEELRLNAEGASWRTLSEHAED